MRYLCLFIFIFFNGIFKSQAFETDFEQKLKQILRLTVPVIQIQDLAAYLEHEEKIVLFDTRSPQEYSISRIKTAQFLGYKKFRRQLLKDIDLNQTIVLYCSLGYRSEKIGEKLLKMGYKKVYNLWGGIFGWINQGYPVYDSSGQTQNIHGYSPGWSVWLKKGNIID